MAKSAARRLTKVLVESAKPDPTRDMFLWDNQVPGFGARIYPSGKRQYVLQYRTPHQQRRLALGLHGPLTAEAARKLAQAKLAEVYRGGDPAAEVQAAREAPTVAELCRRYLEAHAATHKKAKSAEQDERMIQRFILPALGSKKVPAVTRADVVKLHQSLVGTPYQANRVLALLSKMMNLAELWGLRPDGSNPSRHVAKFKELHRERFLSEAELGALAEVLAEAERTRTEQPAVIAAIRLLLLTGARLSEILTLQWEHVDFERQCLNLPDSKTGAKTIYLSPSALEVLSKLERKDGDPYVIAGGKAGSHLADLEKPWRRIRAWAGLSDVRLHDLRHSFASVAAAGGLSLPMIGALLGHTQQQTTARYAHLLGDPMKQAAALVGQRIEAAMQRSPSGAGKLVPIRRPAR
jgi:integrase